MDTLRDQGAIKYNFQRSKYFNAMIYFTNQVSGKSLSLTRKQIKKILTNYEDLDNNLLKDLTAAYLVNTWVQAKWPPMRKRDLIQVQAKFVMPILEEELCFYESSLSRLLLEFFDFRPFLRFKQQELTMILSEHLTLPSEILDHVGSFLYPEKAPSILNVRQDDEPSPKKSIHPIYFEAVDSGKGNGLSPKNNVYVQLSGTLQHRQQSNLPGLGCLPSMISILQNLNHAGTMLNFTIHTVIPALLYSYYNCKGCCGHANTLEKSVIFIDEYRRSMIYYTGILFRSLQDTSFYTVDFRMTSQQLEDIKRLQVQSLVALDLGMTPAELSILVREYVEISSEFTKLVSGNDIELGGKERFVVERFKSRSIPIIIKPNIEGQGQ